MYHQCSGGGGGYTSDLCVTVSHLPTPTQSTLVFRWTKFDETWNCDPSFLMGGLETDNTIKLLGRDII